MNCRKTLIAGGSAALACLLAGRAQAQTLPTATTRRCSRTRSNISGSSAFEPTAQAMGAKLAALAGTPNDAHLQGDLVVRRPERHPRQHDPHGHRRLLHGRSADATKTVKKNCSLDAAVTKSDVGISDISTRTVPAAVSRRR